MSKEKVYVVKSSEGYYWCGTSGGYTDKQIRKAIMYSSFRFANQACEGCNKGWNIRGTWSVVPAWIETEDE